MPGYPHGAEPGHRASGGEARHHEGRDDRPELARDAERHDGGDEALRVEAGAADVDLERQHAAREEGREADHGKGRVADPHHLLAELAQVERRQEAGQQGVLGEDRQPPHLLEEGKDDVAEMLEEVQAGSFRATGGGAGV